MIKKIFISDLHFNTKKLIKLIKLFKLIKIK